MISNKELLAQYVVFSNNLKMYRKKLGYTQEKFAEKCDLSISYIKQIESGKEFKNITLSVLLKFSKILGITINELFYEKN